MRTHPATGEKALFLNPQFTRYVVGYKKEESDALLKFLYDHIALSQDLQARVKWAPGTVVVWDVCITVDLYTLYWLTFNFRIGLQLILHYLTGKPELDVT